MSLAASKKNIQAPTRRCPSEHDDLESVIHQSGTLYAEKTFQFLILQLIEILRCSALHVNFARMANLLSYLRVPVLAASGIASVASALLYYKQKYVSHFRHGAETHS